MTARSLRKSPAHAGSYGRIALLILAFAVAACTSPGEPMAAPTEAAAAPPIPAVRSGEAIFASICATCHGSEGQGQPNWHIRNEDGTMPAPPLNGDGHTWHHGDGFLYRIVQNGGRFQEEPVLLPDFRSAMPGFGAQLTHDESIAVITYIKSLWGNKMSRGLLISEAQANKSVSDPFPDN